MIAGRVKRSSKNKTPASLPGFRILSFAGMAGSEIHAAHAAARGHRRTGAALLGQLGDHGFRGDQERGHRGCVLDRGADHLGRVDDALGDEVDVLAGLGIEAVGVGLVLEDLADDHGAVFAGVDRDLASGSRQRLAHDLDAGLLVVVLGAQTLELLGGTEQGDAAARDDAFLDRRAGRMHRVINAILALLHLDLGRAADADHRDAACELGETLLELLTVVVRGGFLDLRLDLGHARFDVGFLAGAVDDRGVLLVDHHLLGATEHVERDVLELDAEIFRDRLAAGQDRDVLQHGLAAIAEARSLDGRDLQAATETVHDQGRKRFAFDVLGDDDQRLAGLHHGLEQRQQLVQRGELLLVDEDVGVVHLNAHLVGVGDEVGRDVAAVELHALDDVELGLERLGFLDGDDTLVADLLHGVGEELADLLVAVGRDGADLGDLVVRGDLLGVLDEVRNDGFDREVDTALQVHRVHAGGNRLGAFAHDRLGQHGGGSGAVAGRVSGLRSDFAHHLRAHVLELVLELDLLGDGDAVLGDAGSAERLVEHDVAALRTERDLHRVGENVDAAKHLVARIDGEFDFFSCHLDFFLRCLNWIREGLLGRLLLGSGDVEDAHDVAFLHDQQVDVVDLDLGAGPLAEQHAVADLQVDRDQLASFVAATRADGDDLALRGLFLGRVGNDDPASGLLFCVDALDHDAVVKRTEFHAVLLGFYVYLWIGNRNGRVLAASHISL